MDRWAGLLLVSLAGCAPAASPPPSGFHLVEKGAYQALYRPNGRLERVVHDRDGDRRADTVVLYRADGTPFRAEIDTDGDDRVDRWEHFDERGILERVATLPN